MDRRKAVAGVDSDFKSRKIFLFKEARRYLTRK